MGLVASSAIDNLLSAPVLAFCIALVATFLRADITLPTGLYPVLSMYLLLAIGLKGGKGLATADPGDLVWPLVATVVVGVVTPLVAYAAMRGLGRLSVVDAAAIAAHYGSVSAVTFIVVQSFLDARGEPTEGFLAGLLAILEVVGIIVALAVAALRAPRPAQTAQATAGGHDENRWGEALGEVLRGRSIALLLSGLIIGLVAGPERLEPVDPFFVGLFQGVLVLFLLDLGIVAAQRLRDVRDAGWRVVALAVAVPLVNGTIGALAGSLAGLSPGGVTVLATLAASASYIAAPAAVRIALPQAKPGLYITTSLGVTFPFNIIVGIPIYDTIAGWVA